jgi:hypothetical protein
MSTIGGGPGEFCSTAAGLYTGGEGGRGGVRVSQNQINKHAR